MTSTFIALVQYRNPLAPEGCNPCSKGFKIEAKKADATKKAKAELSSMFAGTKWHIAGIYSEAEASHTLSREAYGFFN